MAKVDIQVSTLDFSQCHVLGIPEEHSFLVYCNDDVHNWRGTCKSHCLQKCVELGIKAIQAGVA